MLRFRCPNCSAKLTSPEGRAGKTAVCPKCRNAVTVPEVQPPGPAPEWKHAGDLQVHSGDPAYDVALLDIPSRSTDSSKWECLSQFYLVAGCVAICFAPASVYYFLRERTDWIYWLLLVHGGFFFPMVLLAVVLFDSPSALNPILIVGSILSTLVPYCGMVLLFYGGAWLFVRIDFRVYGFGPMPTPPFVLRVVQLYLLLVAMGLLGRFYRRYPERLNWEV